MSFASTAKVLAECKLKYYRISKCSSLSLSRLQYYPSMPTRVNRGEMLSITGYRNDEQPHTRSARVVGSHEVPPQQSLSGQTHEGRAVHLSTRFFPRFQYSCSIIGLKSAWPCRDEMGKQSCQLCAGFVYWPSLY